MSAYAQGSKAFLDGASTADSPYSKGSEEGVEWQRGYDAALLGTSYEKE